MTPLTLQARRADGATTLHAAGEIDLSNIDAFFRAIEDAVGADGADGADSAAITVDLSDVEYLDSGAITALFRYADRIRVIANPLLMPVLTISGLSQLTPVEPAR